jgi:hypothetical protein
MCIRLWQIVALTAVGAAALLATACGNGNDEVTPTPDVQVIVNSPTGSVTPRPRRTPTPSASPSPTPLEVCAPNPDPAQPAVLQVEQPLPEAQASIPVHVRGWGSNIGENNLGVTLSIVDQRQNVVQVNKLPPLPREYRVPPRGLTVTEFTRPFAADVVLPNVTAPTPYCLWVYLATTEQGRAQQVVQVPIVVLPPVP